MRILIVLPLLAAAACDVDSDSANDHVRVEYNQQRIEDAARTAAGTARDVGTAAGNVADTTVRAIGNEIGDIDVDVDVTRNRGGESGNDAAAN